MSDLIERLRDPSNSGMGAKVLVLEAADELERLRHYKEVSDVEGRLAADEIERLQRELDAQKERAEYHEQRHRDVAIELAEARGLLQRIRNDLAAAYWHEYIDAFLTAADQPEDEPSCGECYGIGIHFDHCSKADKSRGDT